MAPSDLRVRAPDPREHATDIIELCAKCFGGYFDFRRHLHDWKLLGSHYDWQASAIGLLGGRLVTHYGIWGYQMRIGSALVRCGGVGCVATDGDYRKHGLMAKTIPTSLQAMRHLGYDLSILFGIPGYYARFGYVRAWNEATWSIDFSHLPPDLPSIKAEVCAEAVRPDIARLHNRSNARITGSARRPTYPRHGRALRPIEVHLWRNAHKKLDGHVVTQENAGRLSCLESTGRPAEILSVLKQIAGQKCFCEIIFETAPHDSPLLRYLRQFTCRCERKYAKNGGPMVQCLNLRSCLTKMAAELQQRLAASPLADYHGDLLIIQDRAAAALRIHRGTIRVVDKAAARNAIRGGHALAQLLIGTDEPLEVCEAGKIHLHGDAPRLAQVLFPSQHPQLHYLDRY